MAFGEQKKTAFVTESDLSPTSAAAAAAAATAVTARRFPAS